MGVQIVFSGILSSEEINLSTRFSNAVAIFINAPLLDFEVEIDVFLQLYLPGNFVRNIPLGKITEQAILLNLIDTESVSIIPEEFQDVGLEMALVFVPSSNFSLEAFIVTKNATLTSISQQLEELEQRLENMPNLASGSLPFLNLPDSSTPANFGFTLPFLPGLP